MFYIHVDCRLSLLSCDQVFCIVLFLILIEKILVKY